MDLLIIGAGSTGVSAARAYREQGGTGTVTLLSGEAEPPYDRPPLSKGYLRGESDEDDVRMVATGELEDLGVDLAPVRAVRLDTTAREVHCRDGRILPYRWCLLATGSNPVRLPLPGADDPRILQLRTLADARRLRESAGRAGTAVVVGSGFIGCEAAISLRRRGLEVTLVTDEQAPQLRRLGPGAAGRIAGWLREEGVELLTGERLTGFDAGPCDGRGPNGSGSGTPVTLSREGGADLRADLVLMAVGVKPAGELAQAAGLPMREGRVIADARMRTPVEGVLAAGDVALANNAAASRPLPVEHWGEALTMGRIAGTTAAGGDEEWAKAPGFWSDLGDRTLKHVAWGDGFDRSELVEHGSGAFTVWYTDRHGTAVGVLTHGADEDYENGQRLVETGSVPA